MFVFSYHSFDVFVSILADFHCFSSVLDYHFHIGSFADCCESELCLQLQKMILGAKSDGTELDSHLSSANHRLNVSKKIVMIAYAAVLAVPVWRTTSFSIAGIACEMQVVI